MRYKRETFEKLLNDFHTNADLHHIITQLKKEKSVSVLMLALIFYVLLKRNELVVNFFVATDDAEFANIVNTIARLCLITEEKRTRSSIISDKTTTSHKIHDRLVLQSSGSLVQREKSASQACGPEDFHKGPQPPKLPQQTNTPVINSTLQPPRLTKKSSNAIKRHLFFICLFCAGKVGKKQRFSRKDFLRRHYRSKHF